MTEISIARLETGTSPMRQAWRRLRRNYLAMVGLAISTIVSLMVLAAPLFTSHDPSFQRQWLNAQPPGFSHPDVGPRSTFNIGEKANVYNLPERAQKLLFVCDETVWKRYTIVGSRKRGHVRSIRETIVADQETRITTHQHLNYPAGTTMRRVLGPGNYLPWDQALSIAVKQDPPEGFFYNWPNSVELEVAAETTAAQYEIHLNADGIVTSMNRNELPVGTSLSIEGHTVSSYLADGVAIESSHLLGTDAVGRDVFARILYGGRISLMVGIVATLVSLIIGVVYGAFAGYRGGSTDRGMMAVVDILYGLPFMFLVILLLSFFGSSLILLFAALGAVQWLTMARIVRGQTLSLRNREFIDAARLCGASTPNIISKHIIPNCIGPIIVYTTLTVPIVILEESFLAFIGLSVSFADGQVGSWGALVKDGMDALGTSGERYWLLLWPSLVMALTLLGMNALGDGLRDAFDPHMKGNDG